GIGRHPLPVPVPVSPQTPLDMAPDTPQHLVRFIQSHRAMLCTMEEWAEEQQWDRFCPESPDLCDWILFPSDTPRKQVTQFLRGEPRAGGMVTDSGLREVTRLTCLTRDDLKVLEDNPAFMKGFLRGVDLQCMSWGWSLTALRLIKPKHPEMSWRGWARRIYEMGRSLTLLGCVDEAYSVRRYALLLSHLLNVKLIVYCRRKQREREILDAKLNYLLVEFGSMLGYSTRIAECADRVLHSHIGLATGLRDGTEHMAHSIEELEEAVAPYTGIDTHTVRIETLKDDLEKYLAETHRLADPVDYVTLGRVVERLREEDPTRRFDNMAVLWCYYRAAVLEDTTTS
ncbi:hypothetical protein KIPB_003471, partial [Kipferlia bialata]